MHRLQRRDRVGERVEVGDDAERRAEHAADLAAVGMHLDDRHAARHVEQRIALRHRVAETRADRQDQVGLLRLADQPGIGADAEVAGEIVQRAVVQRLATEADGHRDVIAQQEVADRRAAFLGPARPAEHRERLARAAEHGAQLRQRGGIRMRRRHRRARQIRHLDHVLLHLLRQRDHHRPRPAGDRDIHRMRDDLGDALRLVDLRHPLGERAEHPAVIDFLERIAAGVLVRDLADEQQHRRAVLHRDMHADRAVAGAGPARDHRRGGTALQLAERLGHVHRAGLEAAGHQLQLLAHLVEAIEHVEIAFARHREHMVDALRDQRVRQRAPSRAWDDARLARLSQFHPSLPLRPSGRSRTG